MHTIHNGQVADIFDDIANMLDLLGENRFRVLAYRKAALVVSDLPEELKKMVADRPSSVQNRRNSLRVGYWVCGR